MFKLLVIVLGVIGLTKLFESYPVMATKLQWAIPSTQFHPTYGMIAIGCFVLAGFSWLTTK